MNPPSTKSPKAMGSKIFKLIEKNKIILLQDKIFPNIVEQIIGKKISGSWWGEPLANPIYNGLQWLEDNHPLLNIKLVSGKVTYVHESLFSALYSIVQEPRDWQLKKLHADDLKLLKLITKRGTVRSENPTLVTIVKDAKKSFISLEKKLLVYSSEEHTDSGKHVKEYKSWGRSKISRSEVIDYALAMEQVESIVEKLNRDSGAEAKLPW